MHCANLFTLLKQGPEQKTWTSTVVVASLVLTLRAASSWGQMPATNDTRDAHGNTGGDTSTLVNVAPGPFQGIDNTAYGDSALGVCEVLWCYTDMISVMDITVPG